MHALKSLIILTALSSVTVADDAQLLHFTAAWCEPCKQEIALLKQLQAKYGNRGFSLIGVNLDVHVSPIVFQSDAEVSLVVGKSRLKFSISRHDSHKDFHERIAG